MKRDDSDGELPSLPSQIIGVFTLVLPSASIYSHEAHFLRENFFRCGPPSFVRLPFWLEFFVTWFFSHAVPSHNAATPLGIQIFLSMLYYSLCW